ncbi:MAG: ABC transporter substrate-binding protein [Actinomycetota bacterium]
MARFLLLPIVVSLSLLAASCGDDGSETTVGTSAPPSVETTSGTITPTTPEEAPPATDGRYPLTVEHTLGTTVIPSAPERIVAGFAECIGEKLIALGIEPVGVGQPSVAFPTGPEAYGLDRLPELPLVTSGIELDLEAVAGLDPDLIVIDPTLHGPFYDLLAQIAPTVPIDAFVDDWEPQLRQLAEWTDRTEVAESVIDDYDERVAAVAGPLQELIDGRSVAMLSVFAGMSDVVVRGPDTSPGRLLTDLGIEIWQPPAGGVEIAPGLSSYSEEIVPDLDADCALYPTGPGFVPAEELLASSLWAQLPSVVDECFFVLPDGDHFVAGGPLQKFIALDDLADLAN